MGVVARRLKEARLEAGLSQERLGILAGIDEMSASARMAQYETDKHTPNLAIVEKLAKVLNLPAAYFYSSDDEIASLLRAFYRMSSTDKAQVLELANKLSASP